MTVSELQTSGNGIAVTMRPRIGAMIRDGDTICQAWLASVRSAHTKAAYTADLDGFADWCHDHDIDPGRVTRAEGDSYREWLEGPQPGGRNGRYGRATIARKLTTVSSFYRYAHLERPDVIPTNPWDRVTRPRPPARSRTRHLSAEEAERLLDAAADHSPVALALVDLMLSTGLRTTEIITASVTDLYRDGDDTILRVVRKGDREDEVLIPEETHLALREYLNGRTTGPLFLLPRTGDRPLRRQQVQRLVATLARRAGLTGKSLAEGERWVSPHSLRHTAATHALEQDGIDIRKVQAMMGHDDPRTTARYDGGAVQAGRAAARSLGQLWHRGAGR